MIFAVYEVKKLVALNEEQQLSKAQTPLIKTSVSNECFTAR